MDDEVVLIGGPERRTIVIASYDPSWAERFNLERSKILGALGTLARRIDHVGSTAVPGLAAKPIVDIDLSVDDPSDEAAYVPALNRAGTTPPSVPGLAARRRNRPGAVRRCQATTRVSRLVRHERVR